MKRLLKFLPLLGLVFLIFALIASFFIARDEYHLITVHVVLGLLFTLTGVFSLRDLSLKSKSTRRVAGLGVGFFLYTGLFLGILGFANYYASKHEFFRIDSTEQNVYTLAPQTKELIENLEATLVIRGFFVGGLVSDPAVENRIKRIAAASPERVRYELINPEKRPELVKTFGITEDKTVHLSLEGKEQSVKLNGDLSEQAFANAILKLSKGAKKTVCFVSGHGEPALDDESETGLLYLKEAISGENLEPKTIETTQTGVPSECAAVVLVAPERELLESEKAALTAYLDAGGAAVMLHEPRTSEVIPKLVEKYGVRIGQDVVLDQVVQLFAGPSVSPQIAVSTYGEHPISHKIGGATVFSIASSVSRADVLQGGRVTELVFSSEQSWAETDLDRMFGESQTASLDEDDIQGPISLAAAVEYPVAAADGDGPPKRGRIVVFGDGDFVANINARQLFNRDLFLNSLNWALGEEAGITVRSGTLRESKATITPEQMNRLFIVTALLVPELLVVIGLFVWWKRKQ